MIFGVESHDGGIPGTLLPDAGEQTHRTVAGPPGRIVIGDEPDRRRRQVLVDTAGDGVGEVLQDLAERDGGARLSRRSLAHGVDDAVGECIGQGVIRLDVENLLEREVGE